MYTRKKVNICDKCKIILDKNKIARIKCSTCKEN